MILYECRKCGCRYFEKRGVCSSCFLEDFKEVEIPDVTISLSSELKVTPLGFEDSYDLALGKCGETTVICRMRKK